MQVLTPVTQRRPHQDLHQAVLARVSQWSKEVLILRKRKHWQNGCLAKCHPPISGVHCQSQTPLPIKVGLCEFEPGTFIWGLLRPGTWQLTDFLELQHRESGSKQTGLELPGDLKEGVGWVEGVSNKTLEAVRGVSVAC